MVQVPGVDEEQIIVQVNFNNKELDDQLIAEDHRASDDEAATPAEEDHIPQPIESPQGPSGEPGPRFPWFTIENLFKS